MQWLNECLMPDYDYELVVIGGGPAGEKGAAQAAYFGHKTIVIEAYRELGGACINWGTLASKTLRESALFLSGFRTRQLGEGLNVQFKADITLNSFMYRKNLVQRREQERAARNLAASWHNIARMTGVARIVDPNTVEVACPDGAVKKVHGKIILVATGSTPARPQNVQFNDDNVFDATTVLEMKQLPKSMVVIGGGVIGSEYACLFNALGVKTTLVHPKPQALDSLLDGEIGAEFMSRMRRDGIELCMNESLPDGKQEPAAVVPKNGQVNVKLKSGKILTVDAVLYALGRDGNTKDLGLKELGIPINQYGLLMKKGPDPKRAPMGSIRSPFRPRSPASTWPATLSVRRPWPAPAWSRAASPCATPLACTIRPSLPRFFRPAFSRSRRFLRWERPKKNAKTQVLRTSSARKTASTLV